MSEPKGCMFVLRLRRQGWIFRILINAPIVVNADGMTLIQLIALWLENYQILQAYVDVSLPPFEGSPSVARLRGACSTTQGTFGTWFLYVVVKFVGSYTPAKVSRFLRIAGR